MRPKDEVPEEEVVEEEEEEEEKPKRKESKAVLEVDLDDLLYREALKDVLAINEEIPRELDIKSPELREFIAFKEECEALRSLLKPYARSEKFDFLSDEFDLRKAMELAKEMIGLNGGEEEVIEGEPSPYVQELFRKIWQKYIDCKWFEMMLRGRKPVTPKELKYMPAPEELVKAAGERI